MVKKVILGYLLAILVIGGLVTLVMTRETETEKAEEETKAQEAEAKPEALPGSMTPGPEIASRVAAIRGQDFEGGAPAVQVVPEAELEKELAALDEQPPEDAKLTAATALLLAQAGALPARESSALAARRYGGTGVLGAYVPEGRKVLLSEEFAAKEPEVAELVAAHELSRALDAGASSEDAPRIAPMFRDDEAAATTVRTGAAVQVEREYAVKHLGRDGSDVARGSEVQISRDSRDDPATPPLLQTLSRFPASVGGAFVSGVHEAGGWKAVDEVLGDPPTGTNQLLHRNAPTVAAPEFAVESVLGSGWQRQASADVGELDTIGLLRAGVSEEAAVKGAAGWRSGRFETWLKGGGQECAPPCRSGSASVVVWRFANPRASLTFVRAMRDALIEGTQAQPEGGRGFVIDDAGAALVRAGRFAALTFAPDAPTAGELATTALEG